MKPLPQSKPVLGFVTGNDAGLPGSVESNKKNPYVSGLEDVIENWNVSKIVKERIRKRKLASKALEQTAQNLRGKVKPEPKQSKSELRKIEKERQFQLENLEYQRYLITKDRDYLNGKKRGLPSRSKKHVDEAIRDEFARSSSNQRTTFKLLLEKFKSHYQQEHAAIKDAIEKPDTLLRIREFSRHEIKAKEKVLTNILTAFDVLLNLSTGYLVARPNFRDMTVSYGSGWQPGNLHSGSTLVHSGVSCIELRKKQREYYKILFEKKRSELSQKGSIPINFRDVTKYQTKMGTA